MTNTPMVGRIYHVVDKTTGETIKVGSTIYSLEKRFNALYRKKYSNHFLREVKTIESRDLDWYEPKNPFCPFLWHLVAAEHLEMLKVNTFEQGFLSNLRSPLDQKFYGFDGVIGGQIGGKIGGKIGGLIGGKRRIELHGNPSTPEGCRKGGQIQGRLAVESGQLDRARTREGSIRGGTKTGQMHIESGHIAAVGRVYGKIQGKRNVESGLLERICSAAGRKGGPIAMHNRWHKKRGLVSESCKICKAEQSVYINTDDKFLSDLHRI